MTEKIAYKSQAAPEASRRALALAYGCVPGESAPARCHYCGKIGHITWFRRRDGRPGKWVHFSGLSIDHVHPQFLGGTHDVENLVLACRSCNSKKGHRV